MVNFQPKRHRKIIGKEGGKKHEHENRGANHQRRCEDPRKFCEDRPCVQVRYLCMQMRVPVQHRAHEAPLVGNSLVKIREGEVFTSLSLPQNKEVAYQQERNSSHERHYSFSLKVCALFYRSTLDRLLSLAPNNACLHSD